MSQYKLFKWYFSSYNFKRKTPLHAFISLFLSPAVKAILWNVSWPHNSRFIFFFLSVMRLGCVSSRSSYITPKTLGFFKDGFIALFTNGNANIFAHHFCNFCTTFLAGPSIIANQTEDWKKKIKGDQKSIFSIYIFFLISNFKNMTEIKTRLKILSVPQAAQKNMY